MSSTKIENGMEIVLDGLGVEWRKDVNLKGTPRRFARIIEEFCRPASSEEIDDLFVEVYNSTADQMVIARDIRGVGLCPHHLQPVEYWANIGYIPKGKVCGLSKMPRLLNLVTRGLRLQEDITEDIGNMLEQKLKPAGVMVVLSARHGCMRYRGVRQHQADVVTSCVRGAFRIDAAVRSEFLALWRDHV